MAAGLRRRRPLDLSLLALLLLTFTLSAAWAFATPLPIGAQASDWGNFQPDEFSHVAVVEYVAAHGREPSYTFPYYETMHPPLYHLGAGGVVALTRPLLGRAGALLLLRLLSALCGVGTVYLIWRTARRVLPRPDAFFAAALVALIPMRVSAAGGISNEHLAVLGATLACAALVGGIYDGFTPRRTLLLLSGIVLGVGSKLTCLGLAPAAVFAFFGLALRRQTRPLSLARPMRQTLGVGAAILLSIGWWVWDNWREYGDPWRKNAIDAMWNAVQPGYTGAQAERGFTPLRYTLALLHNAWLSFWGVFDGMRQPLPAPIFALLLIVQIVSLIGLALWIARGRLSHRAHRYLYLGAFTVYALVTLALYLTFNWSHYSPQGRYFFVLLSPFGIVTALGWRAALPPAVRRVAIPLLLTLLLIVNLYALRTAPRRHDTITAVLSQNRLLPLVRSECV